MKDKKGQALVEFIIILPILIIMMLGIIDFGLITYNRNILENNLDESLNILKTTNDTSKMSEYLNKVDKNITLTITNEDNYTKFKLEKKYNLLTPGLNLIFPSDYKITTERVMSNE